MRLTRYSYASTSLDLFVLVTRDRYKIAASRLYLISAFFYFELSCVISKVKMSGEYERNQAKLQKMWDELLSDSEEEPFDGGSSDEYDPESGSESSSDEDVISHKRLKR